MNEENLLNVLYCSAAHVFSFQDTTQEAECISYIILVFSDTK